jgi:hypothetical protein
MYKGEEMLAVGTMKELAKERGVKIATLRFYTTPANKRRIGKSKNRIEVFPLDDED